MSVVETDVLVIGAGPAGLTASALLTRQGVSAITLCKYPSTADGPRAHITNQRTLEIMRDLGVESRVYGTGQKMAEVPDLIWTTSLAGRELSRRRAWGTRVDRKADYEAASPCLMTNIGQHVLEPIILDRAQEFGADVRFNEELVDVVQDPDAVTATVRDRLTGATHEIRAKYVIGADGGRSTVAERGGFQIDGESKLGYAINVYIEADLTHLVAHRPATLYWTNYPGREYFFGSGTFTLVRRWDEWTVQFSYDPQAEFLDATEEMLLPRVYEGIGDPDVAVKIKKIGKWELNRLCAREYRRGRLFLAGDAAHRHPPANGLGSNTSIADSFNLAWKLAAVLNGVADEGLLDSYDAERQPVGHQIGGRDIVRCNTRK